LAIPARPQLPAFLNDVIGSAPTPAPAAVAAAAPQAAFNDVTKGRQFRSYALTPAGGQPYNFPLLQQLLGNGISIPQLPGS
jgi:hypothetical protein